MRLLQAFIQLLRPKQWTKNLLVFAGILFSGHIFDWPMLFRIVQAFIIFCFASGAMYIFNDLRDLEKDQHHPEKKKRPLAAGSISPSTASFGGGLLILICLGWSLALNLNFAAVVVLYLLLNVAYSLGLKNIVILDVFVLTAGYVLRAVVGGLVIDVEISSWLIIVTILSALFLGFAKRRHELITMGRQAAQHRPALGEYSPALLDQFIAVVASSTIIAYSLYAFTSPTAHQHHYLMLTVPFVIYGILRYLYLIYQKKLGGAPELVLLRDVPLICDILLWVLTVIIILQMG